MVGNSLKSDILPALEAGSWAVHIPHALIWDLERAETPSASPRFRHLEHMGQLAALIATLD